MRPLELRLEGFKSYRTAQEFNFDSRSLFGIVGPTGAGKSTILEALIFALYGKTPRVERDTKKLINAQDDAARVSLAFEVDERVWEVTRMIRRKGASQTLLRRLDGKAEPVAGDRNVNEQVTQLLGLDFAGFCSSVSLPQGEFDRFLKATPAERSKILKGIFRLERVDLLREAARRRWSDIDGESRGLQAELNGLPENPGQELAAAEGRAAELQARQEEIARELPEVLECEQDQKALAERLERLRDELAQTTSALQSLPAEESVRELAELEAAAVASLDETLEARTRARERAEAAAAAEGDISRHTGAEGWFLEVAGALKSRRAVVESLQAADGELEEVSGQVHAGEAAVTEAEKTQASARKAVIEARRRLEALQQQHAAHLLRLDLEEGQPCPVCARPVAEVPAVTPVEDLESAQQALAAREADLSKATSVTHQALRDRDVAAERLRLVRSGRRRLVDEEQSIAHRLAELTGWVEDPQAEYDRRRQQWRDAQEAVRTAREQLDAADRRERDARAMVDELKLAAAKVTNALAHTGGLVGIELDVGSESGLWEVAKKVREAAEGRRDYLSGELDKVRSSAEEARRRVTRFREKFGAEPGSHVGDVLAQANGELDRARWECDRLRNAIERSKKLTARLQYLGARKARFERLVADFSDSKFTAYLLNEQRRVLSRIGSEKLVELTGHYTFDEDGQFQIVDQRTGLMRSPDTLSGGETFLASLSLALALSKAVALDGGRLGCFFLDEGFGSLDQESLDLALEGIEALAVPGRLIGLISHVGGIQARLDDLIVLEKGPDGSTEVVQHEGPIGFAPSLI